MVGGVAGRGGVCASGCGRSRGGGVDTGGAREGGWWDGWVGCVSWCFVLSLTMIVTIHNVWCSAWIIFFGDFIMIWHRDDEGVGIRNMKEGHGA